MAEHGLNILGVPEFTIHRLEFWPERITMRAERRIIDQALIVAGLRGHYSTESMVLLAAGWDVVVTR
jgi:hypothetical protein